MPDYRWGIFLADQGPTRKIGFGDHEGEEVWQVVPGEHRNALRRLVVTQGDTEPASVEQQRLLGRRRRRAIVGRNRAGMDARHAARLHRAAPAGAWLDGLDVAAAARWNVEGHAHRARIAGRTSVADVDPIRDRRVHRDRLGSLRDLNIQIAVGRGALAHAARAPTAVGVAGAAALAGRKAGLAECIGGAGIAGAARALHADALGRIADFAIDEALAVGVDLAAIRTLALLRRAA